MKKKRLLSILLSLVLVLGLMPGMTAYAEFAITIDPVGGGTVSQVSIGDGWYTCTATPAEGYVFQKWTYQTQADIFLGSVSESSSNIQTFIPNTANITAHFAVAVTGVQLNPTTASMNVGNTATLTATVAPDNATDKKVKWSVNGSAVTLYSNSTCTTQVGTGATSTLTVYAKGISAGSATVTVTSNDDASKSATCIVTVNKADPVYVTPTGLSAFVGQTLADVALPTADNGTWSWEEDTTAKLNDIGMTTYRAKFTPNETDKYNIIENIEVQILVSEKPFAVPATVTANSRTYDGTEKPLVNVDDSTLVGGTMQYALGTKDAATQPYTTSIPAGTDAGTYYVWYKAVAKDDNHVDSTPVCVEVKINAAQADGSSTVKPLPYDGNSQALVVPGEVIGGKLFYVLGSDNVTAPVDGWSETVPTATEPGTYYVWYKVEGDENHKGTAPACVVVTIEKPFNPAEYSDFTLLATLKTSGKKALKLSWTAVEGAEGYDVFFGRSSASAAPYLTTVNGNEYTVNKLKNGRGYRANVQAWRTVNGNKVYIGQPSPDAFAITGGKTKKFTNPKKISVNKKKRNVTLAAGKTAKIKAKVTKVASGKRFLKQVAKIRYFSSDRRIATVDAKGNITAVGAGTCQVFAVAANGLRVGVNVTVQ